MNERLKFSWFNILTFLAIIALGYTSFVGLTYMTNGNFTTAGIGTGIIVVIVAFYFIFLQNIKATAYYVQRRIKIEGVLLILSPVVFAVLAIPSTHFWTVNSHDKEITQSFLESINGSKQLFTDFENYSENRITNMRNAVGSEIASGNREVITALEINPDRATMQLDNMQHILRLQLLSGNFDKIRGEAVKWIDESNNGASTWNVFLLGNTREIKASIKKWEEDLNTMASHRMKAEETLNLDTEFTSRGASDAIKGIDTLTDAFTVREFPGVKAWIYCLVVYLMLLLPYIFQSRNARNPYRLSDLFSGNSGKSVKRSNSGNAENGGDNGEFGSDGSFTL